MGERSFRASQFHDLSQQKQAGLLGSWLLILLVAMVFAGFFLALFQLALADFADFLLAVRSLSLPTGVLASLLLLTSGCFMACALDTAGKRDRKGLLRDLLLAGALGTMFLVLESWQASQLLAQVPGAGRLARFQVLISAMMGLHAIELSVAIAAVAVVAIGVSRGRHRPEHHPAIELLGMSWQALVVFWLMLFALFTIGARR